MFLHRCNLILPRRRLRHGGYNVESSKRTDHVVFKQALGSPALRRGLPVRHSERTRPRYDRPHDSLRRAFADDQLLVCCAHAHAATSRSRATPLLWPASRLSQPGRPVPAIPSELKQAFGDFARAAGTSVSHLVQGGRAKSGVQTIVDGHSKIGRQGRGWQHTKATWTSRETRRASSL